jgi:hypothetical protein
MDLSKSMNVCPQHVTAPGARPAAVARRFELFAVSKQLDGSSPAPTIVAEPVAMSNGRWVVESEYLSPDGCQALEWYGDDDDAVEGDEWKV